MLIDFDRKLFYLINGLAGKSHLLDTIASFLARDYGLVLFGLVVIVYFFTNRKVFWTAFWSVILSRGVFIILIRWIQPRTRPFVVLEGAKRLIEQDPKEASFPSGHAAIYFAIALAVFAYNKKAGTILLLLAAVFSLARVYTGVHYPLDIIGGIMVAGISVYIVLGIRKQK